MEVKESLLQAAVVNLVPAVRFARVPIVTNDVIAAFSQHVR
jgi:hypothetical protein